MKRTDEITNSQDVIDGRDVIARLEELQSDFDTLEETVDDAKKDLADLNADATDEDREDALDAIKDAEQELEKWDDKAEFEALKSLAEDGESNAADWTDGATLIRDGYFTEYAKELCKEIGDVPENIPWYIEGNIDWDGVADDIKEDYSEIDFDGTAYFVRS